MRLKLGEIYGGTGEAPLLCPRCGGQYLHHGKVEVFTREKEDAKTGRHVVIQVNGWADTDQNMHGNPSARRDGVLIHFDCELCGGDFVIQIAQHKGQTLLQVGEISIRWEAAE